MSDMSSACAVHLIHPHRPPTHAPTREIHEMVEQARAAQTTQEWKQRYAIRAGVEGTIHQATATTGIRRSRYHGLPKTHPAHVFTATAINLIRLDAWWTGTPPGRTRTSHLATLSLTLAA